MISEKSNYDYDVISDYNLNSGKFEFPAKNQV